MADWTFLTNHAMVLVTIAREPDTRKRHVAERVGITERAAHRIVTELIEGGYLTRHRLGRRSFYEVHVDQPLRHPLSGDKTIGEVFRAFLQPDQAEAPLPA
jgi:DNA-binding Lrp family transcriptional regulator